MIADPVIDDVRRIRHTIAKEYEYDINQLCSHYDELQKKLKVKGIRFFNAAYFNIEEGVKEGVKPPNSLF